MIWILFSMALFALGFLLGYYLGRDRSEEEYRQLPMWESPPLPTENRLSGPIPDQEVLLSILRKSNLRSLMNDPKLRNLFPSDRKEER